MLTRTADMCERRELGCQLARVLHFIFGTAAGTKVAQGFCDYVDGTKKKKKRFVVITKKISKSTVT